MQYKVMIVDDEPMIRFGLASSIKWDDEGFELIGEAGNGESALKQLHNQHVDIVITDIKMPLMDGLELTRRLKQQYPNVKVIVVTSYSDFDYAREAVKLGVVVDYLLKPTMEPEDLLRIVRACKQALDQDHANIQKTYEDDSSQNGHLNHEDDLFGILREAIPNVHIIDEDAGGVHAIKLALSYIHENYLNEITLQEVADHVHMSRNYFSELFKRKTGLNFIDFVIQLRIHYAKNLLTTTNLKVNDIGMNSGFNSPKHFLKLFKREVACTPTEYRQKQAGAAAQNNHLERR